MELSFCYLNIVDWGTPTFLIIISRQKSKKLESWTKSTNPTPIFWLTCLAEATHRQLNLLAMEMKLLSQPDTKTISRNRMFARFNLAEILWGRRPLILVCHCYLPPATRVPSGFHKIFCQPLISTFGTPKPGEHAVQMLIWFQIFSSQAFAHPYTCSQLAPSGYELSNRCPLEQ